MKDLKVHLGGRVDIMGPNESAWDRMWFLGRGKGAALTVGGFTGRLRGLRASGTLTEGFRVASLRPWPRFSALCARWIDRHRGLINPSTASQVGS